MGRLYKRGKIWWYQFRGQRVSTFCSDHKAAQKAARRIEREAADPLHDSENEAATFEECMNAFLDFQPTRGRAKLTIRGNRQHAGHLMRIIGPGKPANGITALVVDRYVNKRLAEGAVASTVHKELSTLRGCLKLASRHGRFRRSLDQVMPELERNYVPRETALTLEQLSLLLEELADHRARHVAFIVATSARWSESLAARPEDVSEVAIVLRGTKTDLSRRTVPRLAVFAPLLKRALRKTSRPSNPGASPLPFQPWGNVRRDLAVACKAAGVPAVTPNDLRRSSASILRALGVDPQTIAPFMGHADSRMVERVYGRIQHDRLGALINQVTGTQTVHDSQKKRKGRSKP
jgi:integrase